MALAPTVTVGASNVAVGVRAVGVTETELVTVGVVNVAVGVSAVGVTSMSLLAVILESVIGRRRPLHANQIVVRRRLFRNRRR